MSADQLPAPPAPLQPELADPAGPRTLAIDIGGTGLKASVLDAHGAMVAPRVRVPTTYPMPPEALIAALTGVAAQLPAFDRVSAGVPGVVRNGRVITAPHFVTEKGPGTAIRPDLVAAWKNFDLAGALATAFGRPAKVTNDADLQGAAVVAGNGLELVVTLGTGVGTGLFLDGRAAPHLELSHHPFRKGQTYDEQLGDAARRRVGSKKWNKRVREALANFRVLLNPDHTYIGGGNAEHLKLDLDSDTSVVDNTAGILGGIRLWEERSPLV